MDIINTAEDAAAIFGELHSYHRHTVKLPSLAPAAPEIVAWAMARDVTPSGAPASPAPRGIGGL